MSLLSLLFPRRCLCCGEFDDSLVCTACAQCFPRRIKHLCPKCQKHETKNGETCTACYGETPLDGVFSAMPYTHPLVSRTVAAYKYGFASDLAETLARQLARAIDEHSLPLPDAIIAVPLHVRRLRWRGFNQSALLAETIAQTLLPNVPLPVWRALARTRFTAPQAKKSDRKNRRRNLKNAFALADDFDRASLVGTRLWLVDDVATTNTTLAECARVLKTHGASEVWGVVVAA